MAKEPEQVLEQEQISTSKRIEEAGVEMSIADYHGYAGSQHRYRNDQEKASKEYGPGKELDICE